MEELLVLVGFQLTPLLSFALWHMLFLILENMCPPYTQKVLHARLGLAMLVVPAVQWTTKDSAHESCKELNKCNLPGEVRTVHLLSRNWMSAFLYKISAFEQIILFFLWHINITFFHCFVKNTSFKGTDSAFSLDRTFINAIRTASWPGSAGLVTEHRWYVWVSRVFARLQSAAHRQTVYPNVPLPINTMPFCSGIWDQKGYMSARTSLQKQGYVKD